MPPPWVYSAFYRIGAPWELGPRYELVRLVTSGRLSPRSLAPGRAVDLGCGSGANAVFLAEQGFDVTGVDFSRMALAKAERLARERGVSDRVRFVKGDLTQGEMPGVTGPFDLLVDYCTLDDVHGWKREAMAATVKRLSRCGSCFLLWCFYAAGSRLPLFTLKGPSRLNPEGLASGEERRLFGDVFEIHRLRMGPPDGSGAASFLLRRR